MSWEAMLPLGVISAMMFVMGTSQYVIHKAIYGKPKHPVHDAWDRAMDERDARLMEEAATQAAKSAQHRDADPLRSDTWWSD